MGLCPALAARGDGHRATQGLCGAYANQHHLITRPHSTALGSSASRSHSQATVSSTSPRDYFEARCDGTDRREIDREAMVGRRDFVRWLSIADSVSTRPGAQIDPRPHHEPDNLYQRQADQRLGLSRGDDARSALGAGQPFPGNSVWLAGRGGIADASLVALVGLVAPP